MYTIRFQNTAVGVANTPSLYAAEQAVMQYLQMSHPADVDVSLIVTGSDTTYYADATLTRRFDRSRGERYISGIVTFEQVEL